MQRYKSFIFTDYEFNSSSGELFLRYSLDDKVFFEEKILFNLESVNFAEIDKNTLDKAFFNLHLIAGISYYKTYCPQTLIVKTGNLSAEQIVFWEKLYKLGLGEFFYKNQIDFRDLIKFESNVKTPFREQGSVVIKVPLKKGNLGALKFKEVLQTLQLPFQGGAEQLQTRCLVPIGGGKDSLVTAELLKKNGIDFTLFSLGDSLPQKETSELVGKKRLIVQRKLSNNLFELNKQGVFNGHVPISAYIAFLSIVVSILYGYDFVILSNEHSANYGNLDYLGMNINHQYSKSLEFERDFNNYVEQNICTNIRYFSLLRPFYELKIAEIFAQFPQYFAKFTSCNANFKILKEVFLKKEGSLKTQNLNNNKKKWCNRCPKCVFVFSILSPFLSKKELVKIFGENLFAVEELENLFLELLGIKKNKPFECVGTAEEVAVAFFLVSQREEFKNDFIIKIFVQDVLPQIQNIEKLKEKVLEIDLEKNLIPKEFKKIFADFLI